MGVLLSLPLDLETAVIEDLTQTRNEHEVIRRCVDLAEVLGAAQANLAPFAIVSGDLPGLDSTAVARLHDSGVSVVGVVGKRPAEELRFLGVDALLSPFPAEIAQFIRDLSAGRRRGRHAEQVRRTGPIDPPDNLVAGDDSSEELGLALGRIVAVWGPAGSHGRSTLVRDLAAHTGGIVVDADTRNPSLAQMYGVEESSAIIAAARRLDHGGRFADIAGEVLVSRAEWARGEQVRLLAGLNTGRRWRELSRPVLGTLWEELRLEGTILVDLAGGLEPGERDVAVATALAVADVVIHVAAATPVGLRRLLEQCEDPVAEQAEHIIVLTGVRASAVGIDPRRQIEPLVERCEMPVFYLRDDRERLDAAVLAGLPASVKFPKSGYAGDIVRIADAISRSAPVLSASGAAAE